MTTILEMEARDLGREKIMSMTNVDDLRSLACGFRASSLIFEGVLFDHMEQRDEARAEAARLTERVRVLEQSATFVCDAYDYCSEDWQDRGWSSLGDDITDLRALLAAPNQKGGA